MSLSLASLTNRIVEQDPLPLFVTLFSLPPSKFIISKIYFYTLSYCNFCTLNSSVHFIFRSCAPIHFLLLDIIYLKMYDGTIQGSTFQNLLFRTKRETYDEPVNVLLWSTADCVWEWFQEQMGEGSFELLGNKVTYKLLVKNSTWREAHLINYVLGW